MVNLLIHTNPLRSISSTITSRRIFSSLFVGIIVTFNRFSFDCPFSCFFEFSSALFPLIIFSFQLRIIAQCPTTNFGYTDTVIYPCKYKVIHKKNIVVFRHPVNYPYLLHQRRRVVNIPCGEGFSAVWFLGYMKNMKVKIEMVTLCNG